MTSVKVDHELSRLTGELANFETMARSLLPRAGDVPRLAGIDVYGGTVALHGDVGGDHLLYLDFKQRFDLTARIDQALERGQHHLAHHLRQCQQRAGIALIDVSGHRITDALLAAMLHQALLVGATYELDAAGHITKRLFETLNTRFYTSSCAHKFLALIYGEISEGGGFRFLSAGQPAPAVFSAAHNRFMEVSVLSFPPLGIVPSLSLIDGRRISGALGSVDEYALNEWSLMGEGDILLLFTDGIADHTRDGEAYMPVALEQTIRRVQHQDARAIYAAIIEDLRSFAPPTDDVSIVVIKRAESEWSSLTAA